jgi:phosphate transport system protein
MHFHREIDELKKTILKLGTLVEDRLRRACALLESRDANQAQALMTADWEIDDMEIQVRRSA